MAFTSYHEQFSLSYDGERLSYGFSGEGWLLYLDDQPLKSPLGNLIGHGSESMARLAVLDLQLHPGGRFRPFSPALLLAFGLDQPNGFQERLMEILETDLLAAARIQSRALVPPLDPDDPLFTFSVNHNIFLLEKLHAFSVRKLGEFSLELSGNQVFSDLMGLCFERLSPSLKSLVQALVAVHGGGLVLPLLFVHHELSPLEYARSLLSLRVIQRADLDRVMADMSQAVAFLDAAVQDPVRVSGVRALALQGEGDFVEFKSTLRYDLRQGKNNPALEHAVLKTIAAFLNSHGGILLIGVRDDGTAEGIESDRFANEDKFLLHLWTLIKTCLGKNVSPFVRTRLEKLNDRSVCIVECTPSTQPVFLRQPGNEEEFFVRLGPSSNAMTVSEGHKYILEHFPGA